eukprot:1033093-Prymnesium_polylepis.1
MCIRDRTSANRGSRCPPHQRGPRTACDQGPPDRAATGRERAVEVGDSAREGATARGRWFETKRQHV